MSAAAEVLVGLVMVLGLVGVVVPVLPGLLLIWAAGLGWTVLDGGGPRWLVLAVLSALLFVGTAAKYALPARSAGASGAPRSTLAVGVVGAVAGFFLVPVVGAALGGVGGVFAAELRRLRTGPAAWRSTRAVLVAFGLGLLAELVAGLLMIVTWGVGVWIT